jgi:hypothetical protein
MSQTAIDFSRSDAENYFAKRLKDHGAYVYPASEQFPMVERIRRAILDAKLTSTIIGRNSATKKPETYAQCFERLYREPIEPKLKRTRK